MSRALIAAGLVLIALSYPKGAAAFSCPIGAEVSEQRYCAYFRRFSGDKDPLDKRIASRVGVTDPRETRSIALVVGIGHYPNMAADLPPAAIDVENLVKFLVEGQKFDEVIVLKDEAATRDNMEYFLNTYVPQQGVERPGRKARFLFAYSGHGINGNGTTQKAKLILADATGANDSNPSHTFDMKVLRSQLETISLNYFQVLALINACFGGNIFDLAKAGGNPSISNQPGSYALTAGSDDTTVASFGGAKDGSIFFDSLIKGVVSGEADLDAQRIVGRDGQLLQQGGITRLGALASYLQTEFEMINDERIAGPSGPLVLSYPWIGPVSQTEIAYGGFFFLSPYKVSSAAPVDIPPGPVSSLPGRPDIKIFSPPEEYPIHGLDVSQNDGTLDWKALQSTVQKSGFRFIYVRSSGWIGTDAEFKRNWQGAQDIGLDHGAYTKFDYCKDPQAQLERLFANVPLSQAGDNTLPIAIEIVIPDKQEYPTQFNCYKGISKDLNQQKLLGFATKIRDHYGKIPLLYGNKSALNEMLDSRFNPFMIWLIAYGGKSDPTATGMRFRGSNPWTLWQFSGTLSIPAVGEKVTGNTFFGTERQYEAFKAGQSNAALSAVEPPQIRQTVCDNIMREGKIVMVCRQTDIPSTSAP